MRRNLFVALVLSLACALGVQAGTGQHGEPNQTVASGYEADFQSATAFRVGLSSADTLTQTGILATTEFLSLGKPNIAVGGWFSASGQTCQVQLAYCYKTPYNGSSTSTTINVIKGFSAVMTLSGGTALKNAVYPAPDALFDGGGAVSVRVLLITAPASGTVDLRVGSY